MEDVTIAVQRDTTWKIAPEKESIVEAEVEAGQEGKAEEALRGIEDIESTEGLTLVVVQEVHPNLAVTTEGKKEVP